VATEDKQLLPLAVKTIVFGGDNSFEADELPNLIEETDGLACNQPRCTKTSHRMGFRGFYEKLLLVANNIHRLKCMRPVLNRC
jgi:hypothetical protein